MNRENRELLEKGYLIAIAAFLLWEFDPAGYIKEEPTVFYKREACIGADPCRDQWGKASFKFNPQNQTAVAILKESGAPDIFVLDTCLIWNARNWVCESSQFGGGIGRTSGEWFFSDPTAEPYFWRFWWLFDFLRKSPPA